MEAIEKFRTIVGAYHVLGNEEQRNHYDRLGEAGVDPRILSTGYDPDFFEKWTIDARTWNLIPVNGWASDFVEYVRNRPVDFINKD